MRMHSSFPSPNRMSYGLPAGSGRASGNPSQDASSNPFSGLDRYDQSGQLPPSRDPRLRSCPVMMMHKYFDEESAAASPIVQSKTPFLGGSNPFGSLGLLPEAARGVTPDLGDPDPEYDAHDLPHPPGMANAWPGGVYDASSPFQMGQNGQRGQASSKPFLRQWLDEQIHGAPSSTSRTHARHYSM